MPTGCYVGRTRWGLWPCVSVVCKGLPDFFLETTRIGEATPH